MIVAGFGFRGTATVGSLKDALARTGYSDRPTHIATADVKVANTAFQSFARTLGAQVVSVDAPTLVAQQTITQSTISAKSYGTGSVAEASAVAAAGSRAKLLAARAISADGRATCAIALGDGV